MMKQIITFIHSRIIVYELLVYLVIILIFDHEVADKA